MLALASTFLVLFAATANAETKNYLRSERDTRTGNGDGEDRPGVCDGLPKHPIVGRDGSIQLLYREGVIDSVPRSLCGNKQGKNVILVVGDGMGWEMVRAGAVGKRVVDELTGLGCDIVNGCPDNAQAKSAFAGRTLSDYYTEGPGKGLSFQDLPEFALMTTTATVLQEPNAGNHYAPATSLLQGQVSDHDSRMAPVALDECGFPIDFSPLDYEMDGGNMVLWDDVQGGKYPWDPRYFQENPDTSDGFDPTFIMQHPTDSANTAGTMATGHKASVGMISQNLYEENQRTIIEDAMFCDKAGGVVTSVPMLHATPAAFVTHTNFRNNRNELQRGFLKVNPTFASGTCAGGYYPQQFIESYRSGPLSKHWTLLAQSETVMAKDFYKPIANKDPDNGDHVMVCLGGDFTKVPANWTGDRRRSNLPYRGVDSSYHSRWCHRATINRDPATGLPTGVTPNSVKCEHYSEEELKQIPHIADNVKAALDFLGKDDDGFFLMYEQGDVDWAAHANHMDDMLGTMLDVDDSVKVIMDWIKANGGWEKNSLYVTADHDHYLTLDHHFPEALATLIIEGESHRITPERNSNINPWSVGTAAGRHEDDSQPQIDHIRDFTTWTPDDIDEVAHFWGARGSGGNGWGSHSTRPVPVYYGGDAGCIKALEGTGYLVLGRHVAGVPDKIDQMHLHACMMRNLFGLGVAEVKRPVVQLGPRPYYLVDKMKPSSLKTQLTTCAETKTSFQFSDFSIGHRGAPLQFPEHTEISYKAAAQMGAGILECDVAFTKDLELVCRHAQCDLHTTTDVVTRPDLNAKCTTPWSPGVRPLCCTSDFTLEEIRTMCAKMDSSNNVNATTPEGYAFGGTAAWRTELYSSDCEPVMTHEESVILMRRLGARFTPELKAPEVPMPFGDFTQKDYAMKMIADFRKHNILPEHVWLQSATLEDIENWLTTEYGAQATVLDFDDARTAEQDGPWLDMLVEMGAKIVAPPTYKLVAANPSGQGREIVPSEFAKKIKERGLKIITWTVNRTRPPLNKAVATDYYWSSLQGANITLTEGSRFDLLDVLYKDVGIEAIFDDWPSMTTFYANCMNIKLR